MTDKFGQMQLVHQFVVRNQMVDTRLAIEFFGDIGSVNFGEQFRKVLHLTEQLRMRMNIAQPSIGLFRKKQFANFQFQSLTAWFYTRKNLLEKGSGREIEWRLHQQSGVRKCLLGLECLSIHLSKT